MKVAVFGGGYAGVTLVRRLEDALPEDAEILLVDDSGDHLVQHELHRVVRRPSVADDILVPLTEVVDRATVRRGRVTDVDPDANEAALDDGSTVTYDVGAVCVGAETAFYGLPGVEEHATPLKRLRDAEAIREDFLDALDRGGRAVVGGAGLSGVQLAGELAALAREENAPDATVTLLERFDDVAPSFPPAFQRAVHRELEARGVDVRTGATVDGADADAVALADGSSISYDAFAWTGGIRGADALGGERPQVDGSLRLGDSTFVLGDAASVVDADGEAVPASAQSAIREARVVAENVRRLVEDDGGVFAPRLDQFRFDSPGWIVSVGDGAVAKVGPSVVTGAAANALKASVGAGYLSSVGAVRNAVDLVNEELDLAVE
ncbi:FAD-dependent oxidoreductase [Halostella sp. JP-L12]|uniref:NAD(P)/FAD-dependent oxidoreductase n=1 Tax=Halostella TaxID=1843185 RepID=UPI000EF815BE|nr:MULTISPECIES: FAD-dependent oxidoreductase [Halostella]NHN47360.1 FAD-dependent oxidoreductase [Halostella sp. JP-L12]